MSLLHAIAKPLSSDLNRRLGRLLAGTRLVLEQPGSRVWPYVSGGDPHETGE